MATSRLQRDVGRVLHRKVMTQPPGATLDPGLGRVSLLSFRVGGEESGEGEMTDQTEPRRSARAPSCDLRVTFVSIS